MTLPHVSLGNTEQDIGSGTSTFIKGLLDQRARQSQLALQEALQKAKIAELQQPDWREITSTDPSTNQMMHGRHDLKTNTTEYATGPAAVAPTPQMTVPMQDPTGMLTVGTAPRGIPGAPVTPMTLPDGQSPRAEAPQRVTKRTPQGLVTTFVHPRTGQEVNDQGIPAPESQMLIPTMEVNADGTKVYTYAQASRYNPGVQASPVQLPPGQHARPPLPTVATSETPQGPTLMAVDRLNQAATPLQGPSGNLTPRADEADERRARDAYEMIQGRNEIARIATQAPQAYDEAATYMSSRMFFDSIPIVGGTLDQALSAGQSALSPEAATYVRAFTQMAAARAFSRGGATLTANEIRWAMDAISPKMYADPNTRAATERLLQTIMLGNITGNPAWQRYKDSATRLGFSSDFNTTLPPTSTAPRTNKYTGVAKP